jgi:hypothetical protein
MVCALATEYVVGSCRPDGGGYVRVWCCPGERWVSKSLDRMFFMLDGWGAGVE